MSSGSQQLVRGGLGDCAAARSPSSWAETIAPSYSRTSWRPTSAGSAAPASRASPMNSCRVHSRDVWHTEAEGVSDGDSALARWKAQPRKVGLRDEPVEVVVDREDALARGVVRLDELG